MKWTAHQRAVAQAVFVTFLWSTSWVLIKWGLADIPALTFAGLRYALASAVLLPFAFRAGLRAEVRGLGRGTWLQLIVLGCLLYAVAQGAQFLSLVYLPAITTNLLLSFSAVSVAVVGVVALREMPTPWQWAGIGLYLVGVLVYFYPAAMASAEIVGLLIALVSVGANVASSVLGRALNRTQRLRPLTVTTITMTIGSLLLLATALAVDGWTQLSLTSWLTILWLAVVNSAFAFTLWNLTLQTLSAAESSVINNLMMIQIPILAIIFLGERLSPQQWVGLVLAGVGIFVVQLRLGARG